MIIKNLTITKIKLEKQAKKAEKSRDWQTAADLYGQCKDLSSQLFKAGQMSEADNVKNFTSKQSHCLSELES